MFDQTTPNANYYGAPMGAMQYQGYQQPQPKIMNYLTEEEIKMLQQQTSQFSLGLTEKEVLLGRCAHRTPDGYQDTLTYDNETGLAKCTICGYEFKPVSASTSIADIEDATLKIIDVLQSIKLLYTDIPHSAAREYFQIIPLIGKIPELFKHAAKSFNKYENNTWNANQYNMGGMAMLSNLGAMLGAPVQQQPMYAQPQQPMMGQPVAPGFPGAAYGAPMGNPFGYAGASQAYQPAQPGYAYQPNQTASVVEPTVSAPAAPEAAAETTVTQTVTV